jgi:hypothetical protein
MDVFTMISSLFITPETEDSIESVLVDEDDAPVKPPPNPNAMCVVA